MKVVSLLSHACTHGDQVLTIQKVTDLIQVNLEVRYLVREKWGGVRRGSTVVVLILISFMR